MTNDTTHLQVSGDLRITDEVVETARRAREEVVRSIDWAADGSDWPDPMRAALEAAVPLLAPQPVDREALIKTIDDAGSLKVGGTLWPLDRENVREIADAVLALLNGSAA